MPGRDQGRKSRPSTAPIGIRLRTFAPFALAVELPRGLAPWEAELAPPSRKAMGPAGAANRGLLGLVASLVVLDAGEAVKMVAGGEEPPALAETRRVGNYKL